MDSTSFLITFFLLIFGAIIGSFLNVVILRHNTGKSINGRSGCMSCGKKLAWYELVPVFSFMTQGGKCLVCKSSISLQYPLVEIGTALLFFLVGYKEFMMNTDPFSMVHLFNVASILISFSLLMVILVYDLKHKIIPDSYSYAFALIAFLRVIFLYSDLSSQGIFLFDVLAGPIIALPFFILWLVSKGKWIGLGDSKLALGIGWFLGFGAALSAISLSFWIGAAVSVLLLLLQKNSKGKKGKKLTFKSEIPFAPFLVLGLFILYFFPMIDLFHVDMLLTLSR